MHKDLEDRLYALDNVQTMDEKTMEILKDRVASNPKVILVGLEEPIPSHESLLERLGLVEVAPNLIPNEDIIPTPLGPPMSKKERKKIMKKLRSFKLRPDLIK